MRIPFLLSFAALPLLALAAVKNPGGRFEKLHSRALSSTPLKLDDPSYNEMTETPRDYTAVILLTALPAQFGCKLCKEFGPEWDIIAKSWAQGDKKGASRVVFGTLDFPDGKATFQKLLLQTAPVVLLFPPTFGPGAKVDGQPVRLDFTHGSQSAEQVHGWIARHLPEGPKPQIRRPFNYVRLVSVLTALLGGISIVSVAGPYIWPVLQNRNLWAAASLITILLFTSGHMYNHIRKVPYVSSNGQGSVTYFASGFQSQFGMETQIVAAMYGVLSFSTIALALKVPRMADAKLQQVAVVVWSSVMFGMYSFLLSVFKYKNAGYPFHLPPF